MQSVMVGAITNVAMTRATETTSSVNILSSWVSRVKADEVSLETIRIISPELTDRKSS